MVLTIRVAVAAMLAVSTAGAPAHTPAPSSRSTITLAPGLREPAAVVDALHAALRAGRTADALALLAEDAIILESGGVEAGKSAYAAAHLAADAAYARGTNAELIHRWGAASGDVAWLASEGRTQGAYKSRPIDQATTETIVLRRTAGRWLIAHIHWSSRKSTAAVKQ